MRVFTVLMLCVLAAANTGCMNDVKSSSSQAKTFSYDCSGPGKGWGDCTEKADTQCGAHNYTTVSQNGAAENKGASGNTEMKRTLVVSCKR